MLRFRANPTMLYNEHDVLERFAVAGADGFSCVEYMFPYPFPKAELAALHENTLVQAHHNLPAGNLDKGACSGWIGCEYTPEAGTSEGLGWAAKNLAPREPDRNVRRK